jgi:hypothetical protein
MTVTTPEISPADAGASNPPPAAGAGADTLAGGGTAPTPGTKWWESDQLTPEEQQWIAARGLADTDDLKVKVALVKGHRNAEQRIGKGIDTIIDKPAKNQSFADWARANAAALGLPEKEEGYAIKPPEFWPKEMAWDTALEASARSLAFKHGVTPAAFQDFVDLQAQNVLALRKASEEGYAEANAEMMAELARDFGQKAPAKIAAARQAVQWAGERAGLSSDALTGIQQLLSDKGSDAQTIRLFAAIADAMGEDSAVGLGKGGGLGTSPAEARAEIARLRAPDGDYAKAVAANDRPRLAELQSRVENLTRIAARG